ncbi:hypothetical protein R1sor_005141 [Riccia sorocarpa]|uniref:Transposase n=1 Tax=Riccia sorocarpa TaxID=122646 RepID=A0ABD3HN28_9MARC
MEDLDEADPDDTTGDVAADSKDSDLEILDEVGRTVVASDRFEPVVIQDSQAVLNPEPNWVTLESSNVFWTKSKVQEFFLIHDLAYKLKSWIYTCAKNTALRGDTMPEILTLDIHNAADHWAGNHSTYRTLPGVRKCVTENWTTATESKYAEGGETHKAVKEFSENTLVRTK